MGHVQAALIAAEEAKLDRVYFLPTGQNWQKASAQAPIEKRWAWVQQVAASDQRLGALDIDFTRPAPIYSIDTVTRLKQQFPTAELFSIIGGDQLANLPTWHRVAELVKLTQFFVLLRDNYPFTQPNFSGLQITVAHQQPINISSSRLRTMLKNQENTQGLLPESIRQEVATFYS
jgi:nicotinate-nucleotide adenylyltransferase